MKSIKLRILIWLLGNTILGYRLAACEALGKIGDKRAVEPLIKILDDYDYYIQSAACKALGKIGDKRSIGPLIKRLDDGDYRVRIAACEALGQLGDKRAVEFLIERLYDKGLWICEAACVALGKIGDKRAVEPLIRKLDDRRSSCAAACKALGKIGDKRSIRPLIEQLDDRNSLVRAAACEALGQIDDSRAVELLIERLYDKDVWVCQAACVALGKIGDKRAVEPLIQQFTNPSSWYREKVSIALLDLNEEKDLADAFIKFNSGKIKALITLAKCGDLRMVKPLLSFVRQYNYKDRVNAKKALKNIYRALKPQYENFICIMHFTRFVKLLISDYENHEIPYYGCRICRKTTHVVTNIDEVCAVIDKDMQEQSIHNEPTLRVNYFKFKSLFDFDKVEIIKASDYEVEKFCLDVGNDSDEWRKKRYKNVECLVHESCGLSKKVIKILEDLFGKVFVIN